ncbi:MAG: amino acid adenylation domain-containing protein [Lachnospiraceae bacterium]|nr:amino acid adenylation domain-containing protein [Lachnospiraceae bacterium]
MENKIVSLMEERAKREQMQKTVLEYLENSAEKYPDTCAVRDPSTSFTYRELLDSSRKIGSSLAKQVVQKAPILVFMDKSVMTVAAFYGIVWAGCFYVPISKEQPAERIKKMIELTRARIIVTDKDGQEKLKSMDCRAKVCILEEMLLEEANEDMLLYIRQKSRREDLLYIMFTSGSTGAPKGVAVSQDAVLRFIGHFTSTFNIQHADIIGNQAPFDFDVSVKDIYSASAVGATLVIIPKELFALPTRLLDYICLKKITTLIWAVPALCLISSMKGFAYKIPETVNKVLFSGQSMPVKQLEKWQEALPQAMFVNLYGPTEVTCNCMYHIIDKRYSAEEKIPLGIPLPGRQIHLMNENMQEITGQGEVGELYVSGESLSEGYYGNAEETCKRFVFGNQGEFIKQRMYRTGDLASYGEDGAMYFSGRKDFQIKRMGHRIELEEVEHEINGIQGVEESCCLFDKESGRLFAYYQGEMDKKELHKHLERKVPHYMIPNRICQMIQLPMTKNGKINRTYLAGLAGCKNEG